MRVFNRRNLLYLIGIVLLCSFLVGAFVVNVGATPALPIPEAISFQQGLPVETTSAPTVSNETCLGCHGKPGLTMSLENGEVLDLYVDPDAYASSIHGQDGYACVQCHTNLGEYPHPKFTATDTRDATLQLTGVCNRCHSGEYNLTMDSVHAAAQSAGMREAAVCADCHGSHNIRQWTDPQTGELLPEARLSIPLTCARCHNAIYQKYQTSVHGAALTQEGNTDVPTCIDCHGVHNIGNPTTASFRLKSPELCASCHTNAELMNKYGISTDVLNTYVSDFHGTTVTLFEKQSPDAQTNKPVCYDCHGVHDISNVNDPTTGLAMQQNLLARCKVCHPDATSNFPTAWMSHYIPSPDHFPAVYYVNLFYKFFIPLVLGFMVALVAMDVGHSAYVKSHRGKRQAKPSSTDLSTPEPSQPGQNPPTAAEENQPEPQPEQDEQADTQDSPNPESPEDNGDQGTAEVSHE
jgi:hypothetical protein